MVKSLLYPLLLCTKAIFIVMYPFFIVMCPLNYAKISVVPFAILICTLCLQNSGENTALYATRRHGLSSLKAISTTVCRTVVILNSVVGVGSQVFGF